MLNGFVQTSMHNKTFTSTLCSSLVLFYGQACKWLDLSSLVAVGTISRIRSMWNATCRMAFARLVCYLMGTTSTSTFIPDLVFCEAFVDSLNSHKLAIFKEAFAEIKAGEPHFHPRFSLNYSLPLVDTGVGKSRNPKMSRLWFCKPPPTYSLFNLLHC